MRGNDAKRNPPSKMNTVNLTVQLSNGRNIESATESVEAAILTVRSMKKAGIAIDSAYYEIGETRFFI